MSDACIHLIPEGLIMHKHSHAMPANEKSQINNNNAENSEEPEPNINI